MIDNVIVYRWGSTCEPPVLHILDELNISYITFEKKMEDYHADSQFAVEMIGLIHNKDAKAVFSFDYFPLISMICEINRIPYISWIYDCPMLTLQSKTLTNSMNYIYCFDRNYADRICDEGAKNCFHLPLGGNDELLRKIEFAEERSPELKQKYSCDISFLGNLYNESKNRYRTASFSEYTRGFLEGVINSQLQIYGYNFVKELLTDDMVEEVKEKCNLKLGEMYRQDAGQLVADVVNMEISARERELVLKGIGSRYPLTLYTGSKLSKELQQLKIKNMGYADYETEMPHIFRNSKININITAKTIETGVPLRVFDILSCGGFCLTNYQQEIVELFEDGEDLVTYSDMDDLINKVAYYLENEEERKRIAFHGYQTLIRNHSLIDRIKLMFEI